MSIKTIDDFFKEKGFACQKEAAEMIAKVNLATKENMRSFKKWQDEDGTKKGLQEILESQH